jgi:hypothetical protein
MSGNAPESISQNEMDAWSRVINKRRAEWKTLPPNELMAIIHDPLSREQSPPPLEHPSEQAEWLLRRTFSRSIDRRVSPDKRRASLSSLYSTLSKLDDACSKNRNMEIASLNGENNDWSDMPREITLVRQPEPENLDASNSNSIATTALPQSIVTTSPPQRGTETEARASTSGVPLQQATVSSSDSSSTAKNTPLKPAASLEPKPSTAKKPEATQQSPPQGQLLTPPLARQKTHPSDVSREQPATSTGWQEPRQSPTVPAVAAGTNKHVNGMGSSLSSNARVAPNNAAAHEIDKAVQGKATAPPPPRKSFPPTTISFKADSQKITSALESWPNVRVTFRPTMLSDEEISRTMERLRTWDPYWRVEQVVCLTQTFPTTYCNPKFEEIKKHPRRQHEILKIQQASECTVLLDSSKSALVRDWGEPRPSKRYEHGEMRLLVRMLPLTVSQQKYKPRADTHLWPKGTFVQLNESPIAIDQRKQQSHDPKEWKYMSGMLDLTPQVRLPKGANILQFYFLDNEPFVMCVALCSYVSPDVVYKNIMSQIQHKLSMKEAKAKALANANRQTVILEDTNHKDEVNSFIFPLTCPVSQQLLVTPVRGEQCSHWQCFDLRNFVESNTHVTGTRWQCPVCAKILSCHDLEYCPFTASLLKEFEGQATPVRDRIQFFSDGTWKLLAEAKKRYVKKRSANENDGNGAKRPRSDGNVVVPKSAPEIIEIL